MKFIKNKSSKAFAWSLGYELLRLFSRIFGLYILSKMLSPADYGNVAVFLVGSAAASVIPEILQYEIIRRKHMLAKDYARYHQISIASLIVYIPTISILMVLLNPTSLKPFEIVTLIVFPLAVYICIEHLISVRVLKLQRNYKQKITSKFEFIGYVASLLIIGIPGAYLGLGAYALILAYVANSIFRAFLLFKYVQLVSDTRDYEKVKTLLHRVFFMQNASEAARIITNKLLNQIPNVLIGREFGGSSLGNFNRSSYVVDQIANSIGRAVSSVILRYTAINFSRNYKSQRSELLNSAVCTILCGFIYYGQEFLEIGFLNFFGEGWIDAVPIFAIMVYALPLKIAVKVSAQILRGNGSSRIIFQMQVLAICLIYGAALFSDSITDFCMFLVAEIALRKIVYFIAIITSGTNTPFRPVAS